MIYTNVKVATTGLDKLNDYIVRILFTTFEIKSVPQILSMIDMYIKPEGPFEIDQSFHNFTKDDVLQKGISFNDAFSTIKDNIESKNLVGFNITSFDLPFIFEQCKKHNVHINLADTRVYDTFDIDQKNYPHDFLGVSHRWTQADSPVNMWPDDTIATNIEAYSQANIAIFASMMDTAAEGTTSGTPVISPEGLVKLNNKGDLIFANGKYAHKKVVDICRQDANYIKWIWSVASNVTKQTISGEYRKFYPKGQ